VDRGLRIAHVQPLSIDLFGYRDDDWGTTFRYFLPNMAAAQVARGDRPTVHLLTTDRRRGRHAPMEVDGISVVFHACLEPQRRGGVHRRFSRQLSLPLLRSLRGVDADVVHFHGTRSLHAMLAATVVRARQQRLALVAQDHGPRSVGPVMSRIQLGALRRCDALLPANDESLAELRAKAPDVAAHLVPNGVDSDVFHPDGQQRHGRDPFRVLVVSRLMPDKDPLTMAGAIAELARRGHQVEVTVVGAGELRSAVEDRLRAAAVPVTFVDKLAQPDLAARYRAAHALVLTSLREGFNQATLEAMASGTPVVASDIAGVREGVGNAGLLAPAGQPTAFADHLERLATDAATWEDHRRRSLDRARRFAWPAIAEQLDEIYRGAVAARRRRSRPTG
jgi:glycosyltransferase involved in cell wall biosynthesis